MIKKLLGLAMLMFAVAPVFADNIGIPGHKTTEAQFTSLCNSASNKLKQGKHVDEFSCDMNSYKKIRYQYDVGIGFKDIFGALGHDRWIWDFCGLVIEQDDYNQGGEDEMLKWNWERLNDVMQWKIPMNTTGIIINYSYPYRLKQHPSYGKRNDSNILVKYGVEYSNDENGNDMYYHTECAHYEITWCGDGTRDEGYEECDLGNDNGKPNSSCTSDCKKTTPLSCGTVSGGTTYFASKQTSSWLSANDSRLCATGLTPKILGVKGDDGHLEWTCSNANGNVSCKAYQEYCGDGKIKEGKENCDPEHPSYKGKGICKSNCTLETPKCNSEYNGKRVYREGSTLQFGNWPNNLCSIGDVIKNNPFGTWTSGSPRIYEWNCKVENNTTNPSCSLKEYRCGDGIRSASGTNWNYSNGAHYEACDPTSPEWKNGRDGQTCKSNCTTEYNIPLCGSKYKNQKKYQDINNQWLTSNTPGLCDEGQVVEFNFDRTTGKYQWYCKNGSKKSDPCPAQQLWCGDGQVTDGEKCDPADTRAPSVKGRGEGTLKNCSNTCELIDIKGPTCNSKYNKQTQYQSISLGEWLYANISPSLCTNGQVTNFNSDKKSPRTFTWNCVVNGVSTGCTAKQQRCGDGEKNGGEVCDPNDTVNKKGWGDAGCSQTCDKAIYSSGVCGSKYNKTKTYLDISEDYITSTTPGLCDKGNVVNFHKHSSSRVYTWQCENHGNYSEQCRADQEWCGDGKVTEGKEACDPKASEWINGKNGMICDNTCHTSDAKPICASDAYKYKYTQTSDPWLNESMGSMLCKKGTYKQGSLKYSGTPRKFTWTCENAGASTGCQATQEWCGDGKVNGTGPDKESCDDGENNGTKNSLCSDSCTSISDVSCGTADGGTKYFTGGKQTKPWLNKNSAGLCNEGFPGVPYITGSDYHVEWTCSNANGKEKICKAYQEYCGDGKKNGTEDCDGGESCDPSCKIRNNECDYVETGNKLRLDKYYVFDDDFDPKGATRYLYDFKVDFKENHGDYDNNSVDPVFSWTDQLLKAGKKVDGGLPKMTVITSPYDPMYHVVSTPSKRARDNLLIEYTIRYDNQYHSTTPSKSSLYSHKECAYYEVTRCGDGTKDEDYGEQCDPGSEGTSVLPDGRICNSDCTIGEAPKGDWNMKKELITTESVETGDILEWRITVWAEGGNVKNLQIKDEMPTILSYVKNSVTFTENPDNIKITKETVTNISGGTNNKVEFTTTGTLQSGNKIVMVIKTKVNKMPEPGKKYRNVACSKPEDKTDWKCNPAPLEGKCESEYAGRTFKTLTKKADLCKVGEVTTFNTYSTGWTWTCDNYGSIDNCYAIKETGPKPKAGELVIEKVLTGKQTVEKTGQILTWQIKVTASGGVVTGGFRISDVVPRVLEFTGVYKVNYNPAGLTMGKRYTGDISELRTWKAETLTGEVWTLNVSGDMQQDQSLILTINTKVKRMPDSEKEYRNVACVIKDGDIDCDGDEPDTKLGKLEVEKKIVKPKNKIITGVGQEVEWKIIVRAVNGNVEMDWIKDNLPIELKYKGYRTGYVPTEISISRTPEISEDGREIKWKTTGTLRKGEYIELRLYTTVDTLPNGTVKNVACAKPMTGDPICGEDWTTDLYIKKEVWDHNKWAKSTTGNSGDTIKYKITFGNRGNTGAYVSVKDFLPKDIDVKESSLNVRYTDYSTGKGNDDQQPYTGRWDKVENVYINIYSGIYLNPKTEGLMTIIGTALHEESDKHNRTNFACIYDDQGNKIACDDAIYNVEERVLCEKVTLSPESITVKYNETAKGTTNVTCKTSGGNADITIYCGSKKETKENANSFTKECTFEGVGSHEVRCEVDEDKDNSKCKATYTITKDDTPPTPPDNPQGPDRECVGIDVDYNQRDDQYEVTCHADEPVYFKINGCTNRDKESTERKKSRTFKCDSINESSLECATKKRSNDSYNWYENDHVCEYTDDNRINPIQSCFNVNAGNFSIEEGEILPFYWNLERLPNIVGKNKVYVEAFGGSYGDAKNNIKEEGSCSAEGAIAADSMVCTFGIYDGGNYFYGWKKDKNDEVDEPLYKISGPCLSSLTNAQLKNQNRLIGKWYDKMVDTYCNEDCLSFSLANKGDSPIDERDPNTTYSDLLHSSVYYIENFGIGNKNTVHLGGMQDQARGMQAAADGSFEKSYGEYKIVLLDLKYLQCVDNTWQVKTGDLSVCQSNFALTNSYTVQKTPSGNLTASTDKLSKYRTMDGKKTFTGFVNNISTTEYNKNANVSKAMDDFIKKYEKLAVKVSGVTKLEGNSDIKKVPGKDIYFVNGDVTVKGKGNAIKKPFTLVQTSGKTTIEGNVSHNMMLLTNGDIIFSGDCTSDQKVKGIYYASGSLKRNNNLKKNNSIDNEVWCTNGGLHIQGVLIGNGFDNLMNKSRSNLNMWFKAQESEKKNIVMNGASVLIEYSPSIFTKSTMPPGAEDFTTALSIYRQ